MAVREYDIAEKALLLIFREGLHERFPAARKNMRRVVQIQEQRTETVAMIGGRAVINFKPPFRRPHRSRARANALAVPSIAARAGDAAMVAPVQQVGRAADPDEVPAKTEPTRTVQCMVVPR